MDGGDGSALDMSLETWRRAQDAYLTSIFPACKQAARTYEPLIELAHR